MWEKGGAWVWGERGTREKGRGRPSTQHTDTTTDTGVLRKKEKAGFLYALMWLKEISKRATKTLTCAGALIIQVNSYIRIETSARVYFSLCLLEQA